LVIGFRQRTLARTAYLSITVDDDYKAAFPRVILPDRWLNQHSIKAAERLSASPMSGAAAVGKAAIQ